MSSGREKCRKRAKSHFESWLFRCKMQEIGVGENTNWQPSRKAKWCKMHVVFLKMDILRAGEDGK